MSFKLVQHTVFQKMMITTRPVNYKIPPYNCKRNYFMQIVMEVIRNLWFDKQFVHENSQYHISTPSSIAFFSGYQINLNRRYSHI